MSTVIKRKVYLHFGTAPGPFQTVVATQRGNSVRVHSDSRKIQHDAHGAPYIMYNGEAVRITTEDEGAS